MTTKNTTPARANHVERPISEASQHLADWLTTNTGYAVDARTVALVQALHGDWQRSSENKARNAERSAKAEIERAARHERFLAKLAKQNDKPTINSGLKLDGTPIDKPTPAKATARRPTAKAVTK